MIVENVSCPGTNRCFFDNLNFINCKVRFIASIKEIVGNWIERSDESFAVAAHGIELDAEEQRRRWLIQSLLQREGLSLSDYRRRFGSSALLRDPGDFGDELEQLRAHGLLELAGDHLRPTTLGLEWADAIAPWLYSEAVRAASREFELR
jgi:oxygen-independent coproporphyrinogen-3 oxidase